MRPDLAAGYGGVSTRMRETHSLATIALLMHYPGIFSMDFLRPGILPGIQRIIPSQRNIVNQI
jgi:hypothetical protein